MSNGSSNLNLEDLAKRASGRAVFLSREALIELNVKLAVLTEKLDQLLADRTRVSSLEDKVRELEMFRAQVKTWGVVGAGVWALALALISAKVWG